MSINQVGIVGTGQMGLGIAQLLAQQGIKSVCVKVTGGDLQPKQALLDKSLQRLVDRDKMSLEQKMSTLELIQLSQELHDLRDCDLVIESIVEEMDKKQDIFRNLESIVADETILASNTSTLGITELSTALQHKQRLIGLHFFNPATVMKLVEVIPTLHTPQEIVDRMCDWVSAIGKTPVAVKDETGFIVNRLLTPYMVDAIRSCERGLSGVEEIDTAMKLGCNHPMGPLELADYIGLDIVYHMSNNLYDTFKELRLSPPPLLKTLFIAEQVGRKSGLGFYDYSTKPPTPRKF
ncbi:MAG: 3-hydroxybutyryl-CoA dehydrogenase [Oleiphilus sp.]|nr:MAG: 3-hydroxybutyryl-CoA dehydrogenase [Oleiphilus sp.]